MVGQPTKTKPNVCDLCDELNAAHLGGALWPKLAASIPSSKRPDRVVSSNEEYVALVTAGPIVQGHCLILPKVHRSAMAPADGEEKEKLWDLFHSLMARLKKAYGKPIILFEHGAPEGSDDRPCSVSHAHWHLVPTEVDVEALLLPEYRWKRVPSPLVSSAIEYLLVSDGAQNHWVAAPGVPIPSQVLRRKLAEKAAVSPLKWDWREYPEVELMEATLSALGA